MIAGVEQLAVLKAAMRREALARRQAVPIAERADVAAILADRGLLLAQTLAAAGQGVVALYWPIGAEADPRPLAKGLRAAGFRIALPRVIAPGRPLCFSVWTDDAALVPGPLSLREPPASAAEVDPDLLFVPLAAFDRAGHRIGYGQGHYDATLAALRARRPTPAVGIAFSLQEVAAIPAEPHDQRLDYVLTEREVIRTNAGGTE